MRKLKVLDLFSGIGGFSLGLERSGGFETVAFCEIDPFCRAVLAKHWPETRQFEDIKFLKGSDVGDVDVICGGYPCQPFSLAGKRGGKEDDRYLWPEYRRLVKELRPAWVLGENVAGHINMGLDDVLSDLEAIGYSCRTFVIPAVAVDAQHRRDRVWIVANSEKLQRDGRNDYAGIGMGRKSFPKPRDPSRQDFMADSNEHGLEGRVSKILRQCATERSFGQGCSSWINITWPTEPNVGRVSNGVPNRVDRLRSLGNAVVPQIPEIIGKAIMQAEGMIS